MTLRPAFAYHDLLARRETAAHISGFGWHTVTVLHHVLGLGILVRAIVGRVEGHTGIWTLCDQQSLVVMVGKEEERR